MSISSSAPWLKYYGDTPQHLKYPQKTIYEMVKSAADKYASEKKLTRRTPADCQS